MKALATMNINEVNNDQVISAHSAADIHFGFMTLEQARLMKAFSSMYSQGYLLQKIVLSGANEFNKRMTDADDVGDDKAFIGMLQSELSKGTQSRRPSHSSLRILIVESHFNQTK